MVSTGLSLIQGAVVWLPKGQTKITGNRLSFAA